MDSTASPRLEPKGAGDEVSGEYSYTIRCRNSDMKDVEMFMTLVEDEGL